MLELFLKYLSWPVTALIALGILIIVVYGKIFQLIEKVSLLGSELKSVATHMATVEDLSAKNIEISKNLEKTIEFSERVSSDLQDAKGHFEAIEQRVSALIVKFQEFSALNFPPISEEDDAEKLNINFDPVIGISKIKSDWQSFVETFRAKSSELGIEFDARSMGREAVYLSDRRRNFFIDKNLALEISELHSKYKAYIRFQSSAQNWLTAEIVNNFHDAATDLTSRINFMRS